MKLYTVVKAPLSLSAGAIVSLSDAQFHAREHLVAWQESAVVKKGTAAVEAVGDMPAIAATPDELRHVVTLTAPMTFKVNETIGLVEPPKDGVVEVRGQRAPDVKTLVASASDRLGKITAAIDKLSPENIKDFTSDGTPAVAALSAAVGFAVTSVERDEAWSRKRAAAQA